MSLTQHVKLWFRALSAALAAVDEGPYGDIDRQISLLHERVSKLEAGRSTDIG